MMNKMLSIMLVLLMVLVSAGMCSAAVIFETGFEAGEAYTGSATGITLTGQDGWVSGYNGVETYMWVHTYADNQVPFPFGTPWTDPQTVPANPNGGAQFVAEHLGAVSDTHSLESPSGVVEFSVDYYAGPQYNNNWNAAFLARNGNAQIAGWYTCRATSEGEYDQTDPNSSGPWAPEFKVWNAAGTQLKQGNGAQGYVFSTGKYLGFDELPRDSWYRLGVVVDLTSRKITAIKVQRLQSGESAIVVINPKGWDAGANAYVDLYAGGTLLPDNIRMYDVNDGTLTAFDNAYLGDAYEWQQVVPEPATMSLLAIGGLALLKRRRKS